MMAGWLCTYVGPEAIRTRWATGSCGKWMETSDDLRGWQTEAGSIAALRLLAATFVIDLGGRLRRARGSSRTGVRLPSGNRGQGLVRWQEPGRADRPPLSLRDRPSVDSDSRPRTSPRPGRRNAGSRGGPTTRPARRPGSPPRVGEVGHHAIARAHERRMIGVGRAVADGRAIPRTGCPPRSSSRPRSPRPERKCFSDRAWRRPHDQPLGSGPIRAAISSSAAAITALTSSRRPSDANQPASSPASSAAASPPSPADASPANSGGDRAAATRSHQRAKKTLNTAAAAESASTR